MEITNIYKSFGEKKVISNLSLNFKKGEITFLLAPSGSGKTTLFNCIGNILKVDKGEVNYNGVISMVFQEDRLLPWFDCFHNVNIVCKNKEKTLKFLNLTGLDKEDYNKFPSELSGGMKKRVSIARGLSKDYDIILLDEPFSSINDKFRKPIISYINKLKNDKIIIVISHNIDLAFSVGDKVVVFQGPPLEIKKIYSNFEKNDNNIVNEVKELL